MTGRPSKDSGGKKRYESFEAEEIRPGISFRVPFQRPFSKIECASVLVLTLAEWRRKASQEEAGSQA